MCYGHKVSPVLDFYICELWLVFFSYINDGREMESKSYFRAGYGGYMNVVVVRLFSVSSRRGSVAMAWRF